MSMLKIFLTCSDTFFMTCRIRFARSLIVLILIVILFKLYRLKWVSVCGTKYKVGAVIQTGFDRLLLGKVRSWQDLSSDHGKILYGVFSHCILNDALAMCCHIFYLNMKYCVILTSTLY